MKNLSFSDGLEEYSLNDRVTVPDADTRLAVLEQLEDLAAWARENPPEEGSIRMTGLPEFQSRASSGTEDFTVYLTLVSDE